MATTFKDTAGAEPAAMVDAVAASAERIWQAGLGAFAKAQQDGGALFDTLVRDGAHLHELTRDFVRKQAPGMSSKVGQFASGSLEKIEKIFDDRVARSLQNLGVPSRDEMEALRREIESLSLSMAALGASARKPAAKTAKPAKSAQKKPAAVPAKTSAARKKPARASGGRVSA
jgi:poly(hydroxyalkanoate) granule-associated protein